MGIKVCQVKNNKTTKENHLNNLCHEGKNYQLEHSSLGQFHKSTKYLLQIGLTYKTVTFRRFNYAQISIFNTWVGCSSIMPNIWKIWNLLFKNKIKFLDWSIKAHLFIDLTSINNSTSIIFWMIFIDEKHFIIQHDHSKI